MSASTNDSGPAADPPSEFEGLPSPPTARERRAAAVAEAFLRQIRSGGSLDPEPFLQAAEGLRHELEPILAGILRLEEASTCLDAIRRRSRGGEMPEQG